MDQNKILILDVDGVLLDWSNGFHHWMEHYHDHRVDRSAPTLSYSSFEMYPDLDDAQLDKYIKDYNDVTFHEWMPKPLPHAVSAIKELRRQGWMMIAVTSFNSLHAAQQARVNSLIEHFGAFEEYHILPLHADKQATLLDIVYRYRTTGFERIAWVEDVFQNLMKGYHAGIGKIVLVDAPYNRGRYEESLSDLYHRITDLRELAAALDAPIITADQKAG